MKRTGPVLITGGCGFLGPALREALEASRPAPQVALLDRRPRPPGLPRAVRYLRADLCDAGAVRRAVARLRPSRIFHLAAADKTRPWNELWRANVLGTFNLMEAVAALPPGQRPSVVVAGTCHEAGVPRGGAPVTEESLERPSIPYARSKLLETHTALAYARMGVPVVVARMFNLLGPGLPDHHAPAAFCRQIAAIESRGTGRLSVEGDLDASRDFVDVDDAVRGLVLLSEKGSPGEIYNICSGRAVSIRSLLAELLRLARLPIREAEPRGRGRGGAPLRGSYSKMRRLGWRPRTPLRRSLARMLDAWRRVS